MRSLLILAALSAFSAPALADDAHKLQTALRANDGTLTGLFADHVQVQLGIDEPSCTKLAGSVTREQLLPCLHAIGGKYPLVFTPGPLAPTPVLYGVGDLVYALTLKSGKVVSVMPVLTNAADAKLPTTLGSEERRVGKECSSPCRSRWSPYH